MQVQSQIYGGLETNLWRFGDKSMEVQRQIYRFQHYYTDFEEKSHPCRPKHYFRTINVGEDPFVFPVLTETKNDPKSSHCRRRLQHKPISPDSFDKNVRKSTRHKEHGKCLTSDPILMILHRVQYGMQSNMYCMIFKFEGLKFVVVLGN